jgi:toxin ParE1/3/4
VRRVWILEEAAEEAIEAAAWYEQERPGLGIEFEQALSAAIDLFEDDIVPLTNMPGSAGAEGAKRLVLKRFPYEIVMRQSPPTKLSLSLLLISLDAQGTGGID